MYPWEKRAEKIWGSWLTSLVLVVACTCVAVWAIRTTPSPGTSIAILGAVAALMSLRPAIHPVEKAGWVSIITVLLVAEMHSIRKNDQDVASERVAQNRKLAGLNTELATITSDLKTTLGDVEKTLMQTRPHAAVRF
jgi:hypothetical protein